MWTAEECSSNTHGCDINAVCTNTQGSHSCACKAKYTENGTTCVLGKDVLYTATGRQEEEGRTEKRSSVTNVTGLLITCCVVIFT